MIAGLDYSCEAGAFKVHIRKKQLLVLVAHTRNLSLDLRADRQDFRVLLLCDGADCLVFLVAVDIAGEISL